MLFFGKEWTIVSSARCFKKTWTKCRKTATECFQTEFKAAYNIRIREAKELLVLGMGEHLEHLPVVTRAIQVYCYRIAQGAEHSS